jgi:hypothetical protein
MTLKEAAEQVSTALMPFYALSPVQAVGVTNDDVVVYTTKKRYHCPPLDKLVAEGCGGWPVRVQYTGLVEVRTV